jgi:hypothetical protein
VIFAAGDALGQLLEWLQGIIIPDWNNLIALLPIFVILGLTGPILSLLALYWLYHAFIDRGGRVHLAELGPSTAARRPDGTPIFPPNVPYCIEHELIFQPTERRCSIDGALLTVRCPVDENVRTADEQTCRVCGTRYQLGASLTPVQVERRRQPPEGGAAVA